VKTVLIISSVIAVTVSFLCSLAEALLLGMNPLTLHRLRVRWPHAAESWRRLKKNVARPITAILVLNTVAHTGGATIGGGAFAAIYGQQNIWIYSLLFTLVVLLGTEILPKIIGVTFRYQLAPYAGPILETVTIMLYPLIRLTGFIFKGIAPKEGAEQITTSDIITLATLARSGKTINLEQENIIINAIRLSHTEINCAMIPPEQIKFIKKDDTPETILSLIRDSGHSRYPVSTGPDVKGISTYIVTKKVIPTSSEEIIRLVENAKPIQRVNLNNTLMAGLKIMLQHKEHLLCVVDNKDLCVGIVTLEDIASELLNTDIEDFR